MKAVDIGYVGDPVEVNPHIVEVISKSDLIPVIAPVGISREGETLNINADTFASALAARMKAKRLLLLTDVAGVLDKDKQARRTQLTIEEARELIRDGTITGGMIPKIEGCIEVVEAGVEAVVIIDGRVPHCVLLELFTEHGVGTLVGRASRKAKARSEMSGTRHSQEPRPGVAQHPRSAASAACSRHQRARLRRHARLDLRSRQHALSRRVQPVRRGRPAHGRVHRPAISACPSSYARHLQKTLLPPVRHDAVGPDAGAQASTRKPFLDYVHDIDLAACASIAGAGGRDRARCPAAS